MNLWINLVLNKENSKDDFFLQKYINSYLKKTKYSFFILDCLGTKDKDTIQIYENYTNLLDDNIENNFYILNKIDLSTIKKES